MDLNQRKLNKSEWESIEKPITKKEHEIINLIIKGYHDVNIRINHHESIFSYLKIEYSVKMEEYIYNKYLSESVETIIKLYKLNDIKVKVDTNIKISSADKRRLEKNSIENLKQKDIYEYILLFNVKEFLYSKTEYDKNTNETKCKSTYIYHYYTLYNLMKNNIVKINKYIIDFCILIINNCFCNLISAFFASIIA